MGERCVRSSSVITGLNVNNTLAVRTNLTVLNSPLRLHPHSHVFGRLVLISEPPNIYIYIYIYICVCVCVCVSECIFIDLYICNENLILMDDCINQIENQLCARKYHICECHM